MLCWERAPKETAKKEKKKRKPRLAERGRADMKGKNDGAETGSLSKGGQQQKTRATRRNTRGAAGGRGGRRRTRWWPYLTRAQFRSQPGFDSLKGQFTSPVSLRCHHPGSCGASVSVMISAAVMTSAQGDRGRAHTTTIRMDGQRSREEEKDAGT